MACALPLAASATPRAQAITGTHWMDCRVGIGTKPRVSVCDESGFFADYEFLRLENVRDEKRNRNVSSGPQRT